MNLALVSLAFESKDHLKQTMEGAEEEVEVRRDRNVLMKLRVALQRDCLVNWFGSASILTS